jgi:3-hydroxyacyl-CoA dehydrogenase
MRWGFGWKQGPFEIWQAAGWEQVAQWVKEDIESGKSLSNAPLPAWVFDGPVAQNKGVHAANGSWSPSRKAFVPRLDLPVYRRQIFRAPLLGESTEDGSNAGITVFEDDSVRLWHQNDDILILSFKTKMHTIGPGVINGMNRAIDDAEKNYQGLVIWQTDAAQGGPFSAGADLQMMLPLFLSGGIDALEPEVARLQNAHQKLKYSNVPVVAAVAGLALGGGCELLMHAARRVASLESYIGLVEVGVGLVPAGAGLKEIALRAAADAKGNDILQFLKTYYMNAATAAVSKSALEAQRMGYLSDSDIIVFNAHELLHVAKSQVRALFESGYRPPPPALIPVAGRYGTATITAQLINMRDGGFISKHDYQLGTMIAEIVCGGDVEPGSMVNEQWLLDLERKAFMQLLKHPKTQERIMGMMQTGKPVRN